MVWRAAIVGCGCMAGLESDPTAAVPTSHAGMYATDPRFELAAVCDPDPERRTAFAARWGVGRAYADLPSMLAAEKPDVISVVSATTHHPEAVRQARAAGTPVVFLEKPVAWTATEGKALLAEDNGATKIVVNYQRRFAANFRALKSTLDQGGLGQVTHVWAAYPIGLIHAGTHAVDLLRWLFGEVEHVAATCLRSRDGADGLVDFTLTFRDGHVAHVVGVARQPANLFELDVLGTGGRLRFTLGGRKLECLRPGPDPVYPHLSALLPAEPPFANDWESTYPAAADHLHRLLTAEDSRPVCSLADGVAALELAETILAEADSLRTRA